MCNGGVVEGREQYMLEDGVEVWGGGGTMVKLWRERAVHVRGWVEVWGGGGTMVEGREQYMLDDGVEVWGGEGQ